MKSADRERRRLRDDEMIRLHFQNVFCPRGNDLRDHAFVRAAIRKRLGFFDSNPANIEPELIAFGNWLDEQIGIHTVEREPHHVDLAMAELKLASEEDLHARAQGLATLRAEEERNG